MGFCEQPKVLPCTHNMVSTVHFKGSQPKIDLAFIANSTRYSTYDRKRFAAITIRTAPSGSTKAVSLFTFVRW